MLMIISSWVLPISLAPALVCQVLQTSSWISQRQDAMIRIIRIFANGLRHSGGIRHPKSQILTLRDLRSMWRTTLYARSKSCSAGNTLLSKYTIKSCLSCLRAISTLMERCFLKETGGYLRIRPFMERFSSISKKGSFLLLKCSASGTERF